MRHNQNHKIDKGECKTCIEEELVDKAQKMAKKVK